MPEKFKISVGVPSKDRPVELVRCLQSVAEQSLAPIEVLLVDDGNLTAQEREVCRKTVEARSRFRYLKKDIPGLAESKNMIAKNAQGDFILIIDDDTVIAEDYVERLAKCFAGDDDGCVGAVGGHVVNRRRRSAVEALWRRLFFLDSPQPGDITPSMFESRCRQPSDICEVKWVPGGITMYRSRVLREFPFEEFMGGRSGLEDIEHSIRMGERYKLLLNPRAIIHHYKSPLARESMYQAGFKHAYNRCRIFEKYAPRGPKGLLFGWSFFGYITGLLFSGKSAMAWGNVAGLFRFLCDGIGRSGRTGNPFSAGARR